MGVCNPIILNNVIEIICIVFQFGSIMCHGEEIGDLFVSNREEPQMFVLSILLENVCSQWGESLINWL